MLMLTAGRMLAALFRGSCCMAQGVPCSMTCRGCLSCVCVWDGPHLNSGFFLLQAWYQSHDVCSCC